MHMADALLSPAVAAGMYALSTSAAAVSVNKLRKSEEAIKLPEMGVMGAFVFASQMVNFTIPGTGASGHLCGGMMLSALLGPECGFISMIGILLIQCLFFADGGLMALGGNVWNMAFYGCFLGGGVIWKLLMKNGITKKKIAIASIVGSIVTLELGAFSVTIETLLSHITKLPFSVFASAMLPIHLVIGLVEGIITAAVLVFVYEARPEMIYGYDNTSEGQATNKKSMSGVSVIVILAATTLFIAGGVSLLASSNPDGLEWSIERITGSTEIEEDLDISEGAYAVKDAAAGVQEKTSFLPDYAFKGSESMLGTSVSGIIGSLMVVACVAIVCVILNSRKKTYE